MKKKKAPLAREHFAASDFRDDAPRYDQAGFFIVGLFTAFLIFVIVHLHIEKRELEAVALWCEEEVELNEKRD